MSGKPISVRKRDAFCFEPRASHFRRMVGQYRPVAACPDAADRPDSAFPEVLDQRYPVRLADDFRRGQSHSGRRRRPACVGAEPLSFIQVARRLRPPDGSLLRRRVPAFRLVHRAVRRPAAGDIRTDRAFEGAGIFGRAGFRPGVCHHDAGRGVHAARKSGELALPCPRTLRTDRRRAGVGDGDRATRPDHRCHCDRQPADGRRWPMRPDNWRR